MLRLEVSPAGVRDSVIAMAEPGISGDQEARHLIEISANEITIRVRCWVEPAIHIRHFASGDVRPPSQSHLKTFVTGSTSRRRGGWFGPLPRQDRSLPLLTGERTRGRCRLMHSAFPLSKDPGNGITPKLLHFASRHHQETGAR